MPATINWVQKNTLTPFVVVSGTYLSVLGTILVVVYPVCCLSQVRVTSDDTVRSNLLGPPQVLPPVDSTSHSPHTGERYGALRGLPATPQRSPQSLL